MAENLYKSKGKTEKATPATSRWSDEIAAAKKRQTQFWKDGKHCIKQYKLEQANQNSIWRDKYNILYSSTETTRPSLYAKTPKVEATQRHKDRNNLKASAATLVIESACQFALEEIDFDDIMNNVVIDYLLPGIGNAWVRYEPTFRTEGEGENVEEVLDFEGLAVDYVSWDDQLYGDAKVWADMPWIGRRVFFTKKKAKKRFGEDKANKLAYTHKRSEDGAPGVSDQAVIYEIWDKENRTVLWYCDDYPGRS